MTTLKTAPLCAAVIFLFVASSASAQSADPGAQNQLLARRAAEADCYRKLAEVVYGVRINSSTTVRDFATESDQIQASLDSFVKGIRLGQPRYFDDGVCEVDGEVTVAKLVSTLSEIHRTQYQGRWITQTDIQKIQEAVQTDVIRVTGTGTARPELPPGLPAGVESVIPPLPPGYVPPPPAMSLPPIWKTVPPQARLTAERAARVDGMRKLLEEIKGLRLNSNTLVRDFVTEFDEIAADAEGIVVGASEVGKYLHDDQLIVEVTVEVTIEKVVSRLSEMHKEHYHGRDVSVSDLNNLQNVVERRVVRAVGSGVPSARFLEPIAPPPPPTSPSQPNVRPAGATPSTQPPTWFTERIEAAGTGTDAEIGSAQGKLRAARNAEADAMRKLAEQVYALRIDGGLTVNDFASRHPDIRFQVDAVISDAVSAQASFNGGTAMVNVSIPAAEVWSTIHDYMLVIEHRG